MKRNVTYSWCAICLLLLVAGGCTNTNETTEAKPPPATVAPVSPTLSKEAPPQAQKAIADAQARDKAMQERFSKGGSVTQTTQPAKP